MSRKQYSKELKLELVKKHLEDGISYWKLGKEYGIEASIIRRWGHKYEIFGEDGLEKQNADLCNYSAEFKKKIVLEYLGGNITCQDLAAKYKIHAPSTVRTWIILKIIKHIFCCLFIFLGEKQILYKLIQVFFCFSCYNYFIIHIFLSYLKSHHPHFGNFPFLKILWIVPVFEASLLLS